MGNRLSQETVKKMKLLSEKVGEYEPADAEIDLDDEVDLTEDGEDGNNTPGSSEIKPVTPPPPPPPIMNGDNPQLDLL